MKFDIEVQNLGQIQHATIKIRPLTVIAGENGTGKSFFTKSLYSVLNVLNKNLISLHLTKQFDRAIDLLLNIDGSLFRRTPAEEILLHSLLDSMTNIQATLSMAEITNVSISERPENPMQEIIDLSEITTNFRNFFQNLKNKPKKFESIESIGLEFLNACTEITNFLIVANQKYAKLAQSEISNELKENFQINNLNDLIALGQDSAEFLIELNAENLDPEKSSISIHENNLSFEINHNLINQIYRLSRVVFFESPSYWKVQDALLSASKKNSQNIYNKKITNSRLSGVPKYFLDLHENLLERAKETDLDDIFEQIKPTLSDALQGDFSFSSSGLSFKDHSGKEFSKNLLSFGMMSLGMIQVLLKNKVITKGSFIFIDEPETNLHPAWQVVLIDILILLAKNEVNVVLATHSTNILKAVEVGVKKLNPKNNNEDISDFLSVHYLKKQHLLSHSESYAFESENPLQQVKEAISLLSEPYQGLYYQGLHDDN